MGHIAHLQKTFLSNKRHKQILQAGWLNIVIMLFWRERFLNVSQCIFCYFTIISPWKKVGPYI